MGNDNQKFLLTAAMRVATVLKPVDMFEFDLTDVGENQLPDIAKRMAAENDGEYTIGYLLEMIRNLQLARAQSEKAAFKDELTGLYNRRVYNMMLEHEIKGATRHQDYKGPSILYMDLSRFKAINDTYGHDAGDLALRHAAQWIQESCRSSDIISRVGGDEIAVIAPNSNRADASVIGLRIKDRFNNSSFDYNGHTLRVGVNIGIAEFIKGESAEDLTKRADGEMYAAKMADPSRKANARTFEGPL